MDDLQYMQEALRMAKESYDVDEVPVGAVLVAENGDILASAGNMTISAHDPTGHAEIRALRQAAEKISNYRMPGTTMYVTLEPCAMCAAALVHARVERLVYGAVDSKTGAVDSRYRIGSDGLLNHSFKVSRGVLEEECSSLLKDFFRKRR